MALWLEQGSSDEITAEAQADLDAISAVKESAAIELKVSESIHPLCKFIYIRFSGLGRSVRIFLNVGLS